jgi:aldehyde:ferredoxin oxidoreductase
MTLQGYGGKTLKIDLSTGEIVQGTLDEEIARKYIGGFGMAQKLAYDFLPPKVDPWSPDAPIIICPGLLNGTLSPSAPKVSMVTKDPASNTVSTWFGSLHFGARLKWAGYDSVVIVGKSPQPVYLKIIDDDVELCDAGSLWGAMDIFETTEALKEKHGKTCSVAAIGAAGENMVKISMVFIDKGSTWGRAAGSTWGSKNLKAIVVDGNQGIRIADTARFMKTVDSLVTRGMKDPLRSEWIDKSLNLIAPLWEQVGYVSQKNWRETVPKSVMEGPLSVWEYMKHKVRAYGCPGCLTPDKHVLRLRDDQPEDEMAPISTPIDPAGSFGARLGISNFRECIELQDISDRYGLDEMTFTAMVSWAIELFEKGILTEEDTGGLELKEGYEVTKRLLEQTVRNEGFGAILALGFKGAEEKIGKGSGKYAYEVKGTEPDFDARACFGVETFTSQVNVRPARDLPIGGLTVAQGRQPAFFQKVVKRTGYVPEDRFDQIVTEDGFDLPRLVAHYEYWGYILDSMGICFRMQSSSLWNIEKVAELYLAATGVEKSPKELLKDAERALNLSKFLNVREGFGREDDRFPDRWFEPLPRPDRGEELILQDYFGRKQITREDSEQMLSDYYDEHGWDVEKGIPTKEKLQELGIPEAARELEDMES